MLLLLLAGTASGLPPAEPVDAEDEEEDDEEPLLLGSKGVACGCNREAALLALLVLEPFEEEDAEAAARRLRGDMSGVSFGLDSGDKEGEDC